MRLPWCHPSTWACWVNGAAAEGGLLCNEVQRQTDAEQEVLNSQRSYRCSACVRVASDCPRYRDASVYSCIMLEVVGPGDKNLLKSWNLLHLSTFLVSSLSPSAIQRREGRFIFMQFTVMLRG